ncbi:MAG: hypothetical protein AAF215_04955 [Cyanobacteria bacterium P01_A01_bin.123]
MKIPSLNRDQQKFLFVLSIAVIYITLVAWLNFLQGPTWWDEKHFWETSLTFSDRLVPSINDLRDYGELNTPLPFIIFGALEYFFHQGIFAGRLLNLILSLSMVFIIGWPARGKGGRAILCLIGLFLCPYYLWLSGRLYTEMITSFWVMMGFVAYVRNRHFLSCVAFILAIASRQYMLAFPVAIMAYELMVAILKIIRRRGIILVEPWRWLAPLIASASILGWFYLFGGLAPATGITVRDTPELQETIWAVTPGGIINFLSFVGVYIVIPEFILFQPQNRLQALKPKWRKVICIAVILLLFLLVFPPLFGGSGNINKLARLLPYDILKLIFYYCLSLLACIRFSQPDLISTVVLFNSLVMMKAHSWDRYILPLVIVFWYLKSTGLAEELNIFKQQDKMLIKEDGVTKLLN